MVWAISLSCSSPTPPFWAILFLGPELFLLTLLLGSQISCRVAGPVGRKLLSWLLLPLEWAYFYQVSIEESQAQFLALHTLFSLTGRTPFWKEPVVLSDLPFKGLVQIFIHCRLFCCVYHMDFTQLFVSLSLTMNSLVSWDPGLSICLPGPNILYSPIYFLLNGTLLYYISVSSLPLWGKLA
jgi:hypothetical protein